MSIQHFLRALIAVAPVVSCGAGPQAHPRLHPARAGQAATGPTGPSLNATASRGCSAAGDPGKPIAYTGITNQAAFESCFRQFLDNNNLVFWITCATHANLALTACYASCPANGTACTNTGNAAFTACGTPPLEAELNACYDAAMAAP
jgi:hypothetical protein